MLTPLDSLDYSCATKARVTGAFRAPSSLILDYTRYPGMKAVNSAAFVLS